MPVECERLQGFPENWTLPRPLPVSDPDKIDTLRYNALGNAVTVPVAEWVAQRVKAYLEAEARGGQQPELALAALA